MPVRKQNVIWAIWSVSRVTVNLFFVCQVNIMSHLNNEPPVGPIKLLGRNCENFGESRDVFENSGRVGNLRRGQI